MFYTLGTLLGLVTGIVHAVHIIATQSSLPGPNASGQAFYRAAWAIVLWTLFGGYLFSMWVIGLLFRAVFADRGNSADLAKP